MSDYLVVMEAPWPVRDVEDIDDAIAIAKSEAGRQLNDANKEHVEVEVDARGCPYCGEALPATLIAAGTAMVGLLLEIDIFNAENEEHAERIAKSEVGGALRDTPLEVVEIYETEADDDE